MQTIKIEIIRLLFLCIYCFKVGFVCFLGACGFLSAGVLKSVFSFGR